MKPPVAHLHRPSELPKQPVTTSHLFRCLKVGPHLSKSFLALQTKRHPSETVKSPIGASEDALHKWSLFLSATRKLHNDLRVVAHETQLPFNPFKIEYMRETEGRS